MCRGSYEDSDEHARLIVRQRKGDARFGYEDLLDCEERRNGKPAAVELGALSLMLQVQWYSTDRSRTHDATQNPAYISHTSPV